MPNNSSFDCKPVTRSREIIVLGLALLNVKSLFEVVMPYKVSPKELLLFRLFSFASSALSPSRPAGLMIWSLFSQPEMTMANSAAKVIRDLMLFMVRSLQKSNRRDELLLARCKSIFFCFFARKFLLVIQGGEAAVQGERCQSLASCMTGQKQMAPAA
jgi:hypothetical protein